MQNTGQFFHAARAPLEHKRKGRERERRGKEGSKREGRGRKKEEGGELTEAPMKSSVKLVTHFPEIEVGHFK